MLPGSSSSKQADLAAAFLAVLAAITSLMAEHHANEAMLDQIRNSDQWSFYQAESIKGNFRLDQTEELLVWVAGLWHGGHRPVSGGLCDWLTSIRRSHAGGSDAPL